MSDNVNEFANEFLQEVLAESGAVEKFDADVFFDRFCEHLSEAGQFEGANRSYHESARKDIKIDGYAIDETDNTSILNLIIMDFDQESQKRVNNLTKSEMDTLFRKLHRFIQRSLDFKWRNNLEETSPAFGLSDLISSRWDSFDKICFFLISNRTLSERVGGRKSDEFNGKPIVYHVWDIRRLYRLVASGRGKEDIVLDLVNDFNNPLPVLPAKTSADNHESYLAVVPGPLLARIYDRWRVRLLEQNVRVFLQARGNVNKKIKKTIEAEPTMFFAYNNGITATAEAVSIKKKSNGLFLHKIKNFQIVNGGQTTASIFVAYHNNIDLSKVFVQMKLSVVNPSQVDEIVPKISEYANSQNRINAADFFANHPFHVRIEEFSRRVYAPSRDGTFVQSKWYYERARGQYANDKSLKTLAERKKFETENPRSQLFSKTDLAKFENVWLGNPDKVSLGAQKNFAFFAGHIGQKWEKNPDSINEQWYRELIAKAIIFKRCEVIVSNQPWYGNAYRPNIVAYAIAKIAHDVMNMNKSVDFQAIWQKQHLSSSLESALSKSAKLAHGVLTDPPPRFRNVTEWAKQQACWSRIKDTGVKWSNSFLEQLVSIEETKASARKAQKDQRLLNGIQVQSTVVNAGPDFWSMTLEWGRSRGLLTHREIGILSMATELPKKVPSESQSATAIRVLSKLQEEGYDKEMPSTRK